MLQKTLSLSLGSFCLNDISLDSVQTEMEFLYPTAQGWMKGYIDLCFEYEGQFDVQMVQIHRMDGTEITRTASMVPSKDNYYTIDTQDLIPGAYVITIVQYNGRRITGKFIKL